MLFLTKFVVEPSVQELWSDPDSLVGKGTRHRCKDKQKYNCAHRGPISTTVQVNCSLGKIDQLTTLKQNYSKTNLLEWKRSPLTQRHFWESTAEENLMICKPSHLLTVVLGYYRRAEWEKSVTFKMSLQKGLPNLWMMSIVHLAIKCHFGKTFLPFSLESR